MPIRALVLSLALLLTALPALAGIPDTPFDQEYAEFYPVDPDGPGDDVRAIAVDGAGSVWIATKAGLRVLRDGKWESIPGGQQGATYHLYPDPDGSLWVGAWDGLYRVSNGTAAKIPEVDGAITVVGPAPGGIIALGPDSAWRQQDGVWKPVEQKWSRNRKDVLTDPSGNLWIATRMGLYREGPDGERHLFRENELTSGQVNALALAPDGKLWVGCWGGLDAYMNGTRVAHFTGKEGLPNYKINALAVGPDATLWVGTDMGVARYNPAPGWAARNNGSPWSLRHSLRWLPSDHVTGVAVAPDGTAWIATDKGVAAIKLRSMTLADKAKHYQEILERRHVRPPYLVEKCFFPDPDDLSHWDPVDDDNDGQYTNIYLAMESLRYAASKDPKAKENADKAFEAMEFLQTVTGTTGFIARTVVPKGWEKVHDANETVSPEDYAERRARDAREKPVEVRWRPTPDGQWRWKGDTSSDEVTGHFYGYLMYYDLAADDAHKERVRNLCGRVMDYIIDGGYTFKDPIDGRHTRWGVWSPEALKGDPDWRVEAPINAFEILSYLKTSYHITGNDKYQKEYRRLLDDEGYRELVKRPKAYGLSERTHIDDELMALAAPALLKHEDDPELKALYMEGYAWAYQTVKNDQDPFMDFTFYFCGGRDIPFERGLAFLRDQPLDLRQWSVENSTRDDVSLVRKPMQEPLQLDRMLPPSERGIMRWDKNPWEADRSGDFPDPKGRMESSGVFWLFPYWMARYCNLIEAPSGK
jgi:hypothetical protein